MTLLDRLRRWVRRRPEARSWSTNDPAAIARFDADPDAPYLVSFPRTGSHWLRLVLELYFRRPLLTRTFYFPDRDDYLLLHTHDLELDVERRDVLYLYRDPVDTVYSQLAYHGEVGDADRLRHWADLYGRHLHRWLCAESFTTHKTVLRYETLRDTPESGFGDAIRHLGAEPDPDRLRRALARVTKERVARKTEHDPQVVDLGESYAERRRAFRDGDGGRVRDLVLEGRPGLREWLPE